MKNEVVSHEFDDNILNQLELPDIESLIHAGIAEIRELKPNRDYTNDLSEILFITTYPPRVCGIATYSQDLIKALNNKFSNSLSIKVCALESGNTNYAWPMTGETIYKEIAGSSFNFLLLQTFNKNGIEVISNKKWL